jgi:conjugative transfer region protein TrbK
MEPLVSPRTATKIAAIAAVAITALAAAILSQRDGPEDSSVPAIALPDDRLAEHLRQCKSVISDDAAALERCRHVWAESHKRFLSNGRPKAGVDLDPALLANPPAPKADHRVEPSAPYATSGWTD